MPSRPAGSLELSKQSSHFYRLMVYTQFRRIWNSEDDLRKDLRFNHVSTNLWGLFTIIYPINQCVIMFWDCSVLLCVRSWEACSVTSFSLRNVIYRKNWKHCVPAHSSGSVFSDPVWVLVLIVTVWEYSKTGWILSRFEMWLLWEQQSLIVLYDHWEGTCQSWCLWGQPGLMETHV